MPPVLNVRAREMRLRRLAQRKGLVLRKDRRITRVPWTLAEAESGAFVTKWKSLEEIEHYLKTAA